jgi:hypothetical protein
MGIIKIIKIIKILILLILSSSSAYPAYNNNVPNGQQIPPSAVALGHPNGITRKYTLFANSYIAYGRKWSTSLCMSDSDKDGQSNGLEMGDPCCKWVVGSTPTFVTGLSDPNNPLSTTQHTNISCLHSSY